MKAWFTAVVLAVAAAAFVSTNARNDRFDYYILSLSWTPSWCAEAGDARNAAQCEATQHGL